MLEKNRFLKVKNSFLKLENGFTELKDRELKVREIKIKREIKKVLFKPVAVSIDDMGKFDKKKCKRKDLLKAPGTIGQYIIFPSLKIKL